MALYAQHGHGKSDKIDKALADDDLQGVIFGARNETPERLAPYITKLREDHADCTLLLDPQFYVSTMTPPNDRFLPEYPYYEAGRTATDFTRARRLAEYAKSTLDFQLGLGLDSLISPSICFDSFSDRWHQVALNLADASLEYYDSLHDAPPLLLSFVFSEQALSSLEDVQRFLDTVTQDDWGMEGFYLIVSRDESAYNQQFDAQRLSHLLYLVHVLGEINGLRVVCGYSDFVGVLLRAVGAEAFATGWSQSLRQFHRKNFLRRPAGGQQPRARYSSGPLFNSVLLGELQDIHDGGHLDDVLSGVPLDHVITDAASPQAADWTRPISQRHHWQALQRLNQMVTGDVRADLRTISQRIRNARGLYTMLEAAGVPFDRYTGKDHLTDWIRGIRGFCDEAGLTSS